MNHTKRNCLITAAGALLFSTGCVAISCLTQGARTSVNTGYDRDGRIRSCRLFASVTKVLVLDRADKTRRTELKKPDWTYDADTGELRLTENVTAGSSDAVFHLEGVPAVPGTFILHGYDRTRGPAAFFYDKKTAVENKDYILNGEDGRLTVISPELVKKSFCVIWQTHDGMSSTGEMTREESDTYAELQGSWLADVMRRSIEQETAVPELIMNGTEPEVRMHVLSAAEKQKQLDDVPVYVVKNRTGYSPRALRKESAVAAYFPDKIKTNDRVYSCSSLLLIENTVRGIRTDSIEAAYDTLTVCASAARDTPQWLISQETIDAPLPVTKERSWQIISSGKTGGTPVQTVTWYWRHQDVWYTIELQDEQGMKEAETFIRALTALQK
jgi:hypothetical protein